MVFILLDVIVYFGAKTTVWSAKIGNVQLLDFETKYRRRGILNKNEVGP